MGCSFQESGFYEKERHEAAISFAIQITLGLSQTISVDVIGELRKDKIVIFIDGKGSLRDNVLVKPIWCSVNYAEVYLKAYVGVSDARASIGTYWDFYSVKGPHSSPADRRRARRISTRCRDWRQASMRVDLPARFHSGDALHARRGTIGITPICSEAIYQTPISVRTNPDSSPLS